MENEKIRIFVVDDEEIISSTITAILRLKQFEATAFTRPLEALQAAHSLVPDLLISDIVMPGLSGVELARQLQQLHPDCGVLLFSGEWDESSFLHNSREKKHGFEIIRKPVHPKDLLQKVEEMLLAHPIAGASEDRARMRFAKNMEETIATVQADIAVSTARKRAMTKRDSGK